MVCAKMFARYFMLYALSFCHFYSTEFPKVQMLYKNTPRLLELSQNPCHHPLIRKTLFKAAKQSFCFFGVANGDLSRLLWSLKAILAIVSTQNGEKIKINGFWRAGPGREHASPQNHKQFVQRS